MLALSSYRSGFFSAPGTCPFRQESSDTSGEAWLAGHSSVREGRGWGVCVSEPPWHWESHSACWPGSERDQGLKGTREQSMAIIGVLFVVTGFGIPRSFGAKSHSLDSRGIRKLAKEFSPSEVKEK